LTLLKKKMHTRCLNFVVFHRDHCRISFSSQFTGYKNLNCWGCI